MMDGDEATLQASSAETRADDSRQTPAAAPASGVTPNLTMPAVMSSVVKAQVKFTDSRLKEAEVGADICDAIHPSS